MKTIEGIEFSFFYDYDELKNGKLSQLSNTGKVEWLNERVNIMLLRPVKTSFDKDSDVYNMMNSNIGGLKRNFIICMFSVLMNGIEALGSFINKQDSTKKDNFFSFMQKYMPDWNTELNKGYHANKNLIDVLWKHYRNGIAHGFIIEHGGIDYEADRTENGYLITNYGALQVGPVRFIEDFEKGLKDFFDDLRSDKGNIQQLFVDRFNSFYPPIQ